MAGSYRDIILPALEAEFATDRRGVAASYNGGDEIGVIFTIRDQEGATGRRQGSARVAELLVLVSDVATWDYGDKVVVDGVTWTVTRELDGSNWFKHCLHVESDRRLRP